MQVRYDGLAFGESPRWHDGRLWVCDWGAHSLLVFDEDGRPEVVARVDSFPFCIDWLPDGRLLIVNAARQAVVRESGEVYADLSGLGPHPPGNEIVVHPNGWAYVNGGELLARVDPDGSAWLVADGLAFANGMAISPDGTTLIVAESHAACLTAFTIELDGGLSGRRVWAAVDGSAPDGICLDDSGAIWYADVPNRCCVRVREGGEVLQRIAADRGCFSCALGGHTLFVVAREWHGMSDLAAGNAPGRFSRCRSTSGGEFRAPAPVRNRPRSHRSAACGQKRTISVRLWPRSCRLPVRATLSTATSLRSAGGRIRGARASYRHDVTCSTGRGRVSRERVAASAPSRCISGHDRVRGGSAPH